MTSPKLWFAFLFGGFLLSVPGILAGSPQQDSSSAKEAGATVSATSSQAQTGSTGPSPTAGQSSSAGQDTDEIQEEVGDRDPTYVRTRAVFRYDYKEQVGNVDTNRFRLKMLYGFGPKQRFGVSVVVPVMYRSTSTASAFGSGDTEVTTGANFYTSERFRTGATFQVTFQTASENLLGGASTNIKPAWGFTWVLSNRFEFVGSFYYQQSIHITRGGATKQFEPDISLNVRVRRATWFVESDSYYDINPSRFAPMIKMGVSRGFGHGEQWIAAIYYEIPLNGYGRETQEQFNTGLDLTWFPFRHR